MNGEDRSILGGFCYTGGMTKPKDITLTGEKVLISADKAPEKSKSGLYLTESWKTLPPFGEVVAIGPEVKTVKVGDRVIFERYGSVTIQLEHGEKEDYRVCLEKHVIAKVDK